jgi:predicted ATPase/DNA-binding CsgD family transcriptional regulator
MSVVPSSAEFLPDEGSPIPMFGRLVLPNLPLPLTPLLGREREVADTVRLLQDPEVRLVTFTGPGGIGKTRLSLAVAAALPGQTAFVALAATFDPQLLAATIARELGLEFIRDLPPDAFLRYALRDQQLTLVLDNFEQLLAGATVVSELLGACPGLQAIVTSRTRLSISGEHVIPIGPLGLPQPGHQPTSRDIAEASAVRLFVERARAAHPTFALTDRNAGAVATICHRLDGLPLAIELAAARSNLLSPQALAARLENRLQVLTGGPRDAPARLQTMRAAIAWSNDLLDADERTIWTRLGVFSGGFTAEAAEAVGLAAEFPGLDCLAVLDSLVGQGLLRMSANADGEPRFQMLETTREFALEQLRSANLEGSDRTAHAAWFNQFARIAGPGLMGPDSGAWFNRAEADIANIRLALGWHRDQGSIAEALELANDLAWFWTAPNYISEGRTWYDALLDLAGEDVDPAIRAVAIAAAGDLADWHTDSARAEALHEQALVLWRDLGDRSRIASTLRSLGSVAIDRFAFDRAVTLLSEAHALAVEVDDAWNAAATANLLGVTLREQGRYADAVRWHEEALVRWQRSNHRDHLPIALCGLGWAYLDLGEELRAWESYDASISLSGEHEASHDSAWALVGFGALAFRIGQPATAAQLLAVAASQRAVLGLPLRPPTQSHTDKLVEDIRARLGNAAFAVAWDQGQSMSNAEAFRLARAVRVPVPNVGDGLSRREHEVLDLLVEGASDHEIADRLFISRRTASKHVAAILEKLGATNRTAAATVAHRRGLV